MKRLLCILLIIISIFSITGCAGEKKAKALTGNDRIAYDMMLEVCYVAKDPTKVKVISGTAGTDTGVFKVSYNEGENTYNVMVLEKNGKYEVQKLNDSLVSSYSDLLYNTDSFSVSKVNKALNEKWKS